MLSATPRLFLKGKTKDQITTVAGSRHYGRTRKEQSGIAKGNKKMETISSVYRRGVVSEEGGQSRWVTGATESAGVVFRFANVSIRGH